MPASLPTLSQIDSDRFGIRVARSRSLTAQDVPSAVAWCQEQQVAMLIARCGTDDMAAVHAMLRHEFQLMDCLVTYERQLEQLPRVGVPEGITLGIAVPDDADAVERLAGGTFGEHRGHYHADPRLDRAACDAVYASWARSAVADLSPGTATVVARDDVAVVGFITVTDATSEKAVGGVAGVAPSHRGKGIYRALVAERLRIARERGARRTVVSAHIANIGPQACWTDLGYRLIGSEYTFHWWASDEAPVARDREGSEP